MGRIVAVLFWSMVVASVARGQSTSTTPTFFASHRCDSCGRCDCAGPQDCASRPPAAPPASPPQAPPQPTGYYAAPPQNGVLEGASNSYELEGLTLRFPSLDLKFPCIRLPCITKLHRQPRMAIDSAHAPYVHQIPYGAPVAIQTVPTPPQAPPSQSPPQCDAPFSPGCNAPYSPPKCDTTFLELERRIQEREERIDQLDRQIAQLATTMERLVTVVDRVGSTEHTNPPQSVVTGVRAIESSGPGAVPAQYERPMIRRMPKIDEEVATEPQRAEPRRLPAIDDADQRPLWNPQAIGPRR